MINYNCKKCGKEFSQNKHYIKHLNEKNLCNVENNVKKLIDIVEEKINNIKDHNLNIIETFVGAGGAHLGFQKAGFKSLLVNDNEKYTIDTLLLNKVINNDEYLLCSIEDITENLIKSKINNKKVDVLFGGIVCKGFSLAGVRNPFDSRNYLYKHQLRLVDILKPKVSIIENVTAIKNMILYIKCQETSEIFKEYTKLSDTNKLLNGEKSSRRKNAQDYNDLNLKINKNKKQMQILLLNVEKYKYYVLDDIKKKYEEMGYKFYNKILQTDKLVVIQIEKELLS